MMDSGGRDALPISRVLPLTLPFTIVMHPDWLKPLKGAFYGANYFMVLRDKLEPNKFWRRLWWPSFESTNKEPCLP